MEIFGTVEDIIFRNSENGFSIIDISSDDTLITCTGMFPILGPGETVKLSGKFEMNPKYGRQFSADSIEVQAPTSCNAIMKYLASGLISGVGPVTAANIVLKFKEDTLNIIETAPEKLASIRGISKLKAAEIHKTFADIKKMQGAVMFLQKYDISINLAVRIYEQYKEATESVLKTNPYRMVEDIFGIGFKTADKIAQKMGIDPKSEFRIRAGIIYVIEQIAERQGSTVCFENETKTAVIQLLELDENCLDLIDNAIISMEVDGVLRKVTYGDSEAICLSKFYTYEKTIASKIKMLQNSAETLPVDMDREIKDYELANNIELHEKQKEAIVAAVQDGFVIITGGPGTGKTTIIKAIIRLFKARGRKCMLLAPTGRAAKRLEEQTKEQASTIHRGLEANFQGGTRGFSRNENNPLDADVVIVDEVSMVDSFLAYSLLRAVAPGTRVVFVGDKDQLPSVGAGNVLADLIASKEVVVKELTRIYRQGEDSMIVENAHLINNQEMPDLSKKSSDFFYAQGGEPSDVAKAIVDMVATRIPGYVKGIKPEDIQVIAPMKSGVAGTLNLNVLLQARLNPPSEIKPEITINKVVYRVGDKVMQIANNYEQEWTKENGIETVTGSGVFNGDMGYITDINKQTGAVSVLFEDGRKSIYSSLDLDSLVHSYAITVHKSQGSEFPIVIIPILGGNPLLYNKNLLYTAVTRAKKMVVLMGKQTFIYHMVKNEYSLVRNTLLKQFMISNLPF